MEFSVLYNLLLESGVELQTFGALWGYKAQFGVEKTLIVICQLPAARILPIKTASNDSMTLHKMAVPKEAAIPMAKHPTMALQCLKKPEAKQKRGKL